MRIGTLAQLSGVNERLLRYYEQQGLLRPARGPNGYREYADSDVGTVARIRALLDAGLPTAVIAEILDCVHDDGPGRIRPEPCPGVLAHLRREHARTAAAIDRLQTSQRALDTLLTRMGTVEPRTPTV